MGRVRSAAAAALAAACGVAAHGHVNFVIVNGVRFPGFDVTSDPYKNPPPVVAGWSSTNLDNGFVEPNNFGTPDVICHRGAENAKAFITVEAGDSLTFQWDTWPDSHQGPVTDYLAPCPDDRCDTVDKTTLSFFKIAEVGRIVEGVPGTWAADVLIQNGFQWTTQIPANVAPGHYVLRHSILAHHASRDPNGAQDYPYCFNIKVTGSGTASPAGTPGQSLMKADDPGVLFDIFTGPHPYIIPGPPLMEGASSSVAQSSVTFNAIAGPTFYDGTVPTTVATTMQTVTTSSPPTSTTNPGGCVGLYVQCGGIGHTGPTCCSAGTCTFLNEYYSQCQ